MNLLKNKEYSTFDEHIEYLEERINDDERYIQETITEIEMYREELEEVKKQKNDFLENSNYEPSIYVDGIKDKKLKHDIFEWCKSHEMENHKELIGNYRKHNKMCSEKKNPTYKFIMSSLRIGELSSVVCVDCYQKAIKNNENTNFAFYNC